MTLEQLVPGDHKELQDQIILHGDYIDQMDLLPLLADSNIRSMVIMEVQYN